MEDRELTDEEIAENYAKGLCKTCTFDTCRHNALQTCTIKESLKQAYLDGLEASKPKWHEIESKVTPKREISKQYMPKNKEKVLLKYHFSGDDEIHISDGYYDAYDFEFHIANNPKFRIVCVIAWKEIELPKEIEQND